MEDQLIKNLSDTINEFEKNKSKLIKQAFDSGGEDEVNKIWDEYITLLDARYELIRKQLDKNNHKYQDLLNKTIQETDKLKRSIKQLDKTDEIIKFMTSTINLIGKVVLVLGL